MSVIFTALAPAMAQPANTVSFGGKPIAIDMTSCSPENSSNGKNRAIAAINSASSSSATLQFSSLNPAAGSYTTVDDDDALAAGKVIIGLGGSAFGGVFMAKPGQTITLSKTGARYQASLADITVLDIMTKAVTAKRLSGSFGCE